MPTTRRKNAAKSNQSQSTLSFNSKAARISKPSVTEPNSGIKKSSSTTKKLPEIAEEQVAQAVSVEAPTTTDITTPEPEEKQQAEEVQVAVRQSPSKSSSTPTRKKKLAKKTDGKTEREQAAEKITDAQLKKYWKAEEDSRLAPRVHQSTLSLHEKVLRHFDLSSQYGPCIGIPRLTRWKRANKLGLDPPVEVLAVLIREENQKTSQGCGRMAYIDELSGGGGRGLAVLVE